MRRFVLISAVVALMQAAIPAASATFVPGPNGKVAFSSGRASLGIPIPGENDADARIWVADYPDGPPVQVTTLPEGVQHRHPSWSPDHSRIVYSAGPVLNPNGEYALWIADLRTGRQTEFVPAAAGQDRPAWSPNGLSIAYASQGDLWVKEVAAGSIPVQLTATTAIEENPVWSPDGETLYYNRGPSTNRDLWSKSPVTPGGEEISVLVANSNDWQPSVSPSGNRLCFVRGAESTGDLWTVNANGTQPAVFSATPAAADLDCVWSPDGTRILYTLGFLVLGDLFQRDINTNQLPALLNLNVVGHIDGHADWATNFPPLCAARTAKVDVNSPVAFALSCVDPDHGTGAEPPVAVPLEPETLEIAMGPSWGTLSDISNGTVTYTPKPGFNGTDSFTYTGSDGTTKAVPTSVVIQVGNPPAPDTLAPAVSGIRVAPKKWRLAKAAPAKRSAVPVGTTISFELSEPARATIGFERIRPGKRVGKKCAKPTKGNHMRKSCTRYVSAGTLGVAATGGPNRFRFTGQVSRTRTLPLGSYRLTVGARDAAGNSAPPQPGPTFTIVD